MKEISPFFGVPIGIKDLNAVAGLPTSYGVAVLRNQMTEEDDAVVTRLKQAGFIVLGKTATSELGSFPFTEPPGFPPTRNPWHLDYTAGGSSGGSAAAVAAGFCPIAQGSDGGGSIRTPAMCCGLVGIKPSRGRVSHAPVGDYQSGISVNGPLARTVADAAAMLDIISGYVTGDPYWLPNPEISFLEATHQILPKLKIAFSTTLKPFGETSPVYREAIRKTVGQLTEMGHFVDEGCPDWQNLAEPFRRVWQAGVTAAGVPLEVLSPLNRWLGKHTGTAGDYLQAVHQMQVISRRIVAFFATVDVLVLPVCLHQPPKIGEWEDLPPEEAVDKIINWIAPCPPFNASGLPAISLPVGLDETGLPVGVQLIGKPADEVTLIGLAAQLEAINGWNYIPPLWNDQFGSPSEMKR